MSKKMKMDDWFNRIDASSKIFNRWHKDYQKWVSFYRGQQWTTDEALQGFDPIVINYTFNTIKTMLPTLYYKNPKIYVHPTRPEYALGAEINEYIVNYDFRMLGIKQEMRRAILRALIGGLAWVETGWASEFESINADEEELSNEEVDRIVSGGATVSETPAYTELKIKRDAPFAISRSMLDVRFDPFANIFDEQGWYAVRELAPIEHVKDDPRYEGTKNLVANATFDNQIILNTFRDDYRKDSDLKFVELWHITDRWTGKTTTYARGHMRKLRQFDTPEGYDLMPLFFNEDPEQPQPISVVELIGDTQREINRMRSLMLEHIKRTLPRLAVDRTQVPDEADLKRLTESDMDEVISWPGVPSQSIMPINFPSLSPEMFSVDQKLKDDINIGAGLTDFQRGQAVKVPSATEAQLIEQSSRLRVDEGLDNVSDFCSKLSRNLIKLRQQFTTGEQAVRIDGERSSEWKNYTRQDIQGDYEFTTEYGSTQKRDQDYMKAQWANLLPNLVPLMQNPDPRFAELGRQILKVYEIPIPIADKIFPQPQAPVPFPDSAVQSPQQAPGQPGLDIGQLLQGLGR